VSPILLGISTAMAIAGLRFLWKSQHRLDLRGYLVQAGMVIVGLILMILAFYVPRGTAALTVAIGGGALLGGFFLFPDIVYYLLRFYDRRKGRRGDGIVHEQ
jgi:hypothetical protein